MSGTKKPATRLTKKAKAEAVAVPKSNGKTFKSDEYVKDSDDDEGEAGSTFVEENLSAPIKPKAAIQPPKKKNGSSKPILALPKPIRADQTPTPTSDTSVSGRDEESDNTKGSVPNILEINGSENFQSKAVAKRLDIVTRPLLKRKGTSTSISGTAFSESNEDKSSSPTYAKRQKGGQLLKAKTGMAETTALLAKPSMDKMSSASDGDAQTESDRDNETDSGSENGPESQSQNGSDQDPTLATRTRAKYGHFAIAAQRDMTKSLQCPARFDSSIAPIRTAT